MAKLYFGKISTDSKFAPQFQQNYYAGGKKNSSWYNGLEVGDYVFPIFEQSIAKLWRVKEFSEQPNPINNRGGSVNFEVIKEFNPPISISSTFARYKHFVLNLNLVNKSVKSTAKEHIGFFPIDVTANCPDVPQIDFNALRNIYIILEEQISMIKLNEDDICLILDDINNLKLKSIKIFKNNTLSEYESLLKLYKDKNPNGMNSLYALLNVAIEDKRPNKENYLKIVIDDLKKKGLFLVNNPIAMYDYVFVSRRKRKVNKDVDVNEPDNEPDIDEEFSIEEFEEYKDLIELVEKNPNLILYGPPGTGKTYSAFKLIELRESNISKKDVRIEDMIDEGRVRIVTFHQSFSYEEFVEGIRPLFNPEGETESSDIRYEIKDGILKEIANNAISNQIRVFTDIEGLNSNSKIWKISLGAKNVNEEEMFNDALKTNSISIGFDDDKDLTDWDYDKIYELLDNPKKEIKPTHNANSVNYFVNEMQIGDIVLVFANKKSIKAIGIITGTYKWKKELVNKHAHRRDVRWLKIFKQPYEILRFNNNYELTRPTVYPLKRMNLNNVKELLDLASDHNLDKVKNAQLFYLVIDEINRANISKVFGELITLLEKDKRDNTKIRLPYSQKDFSLPSNLVIIGTMNTADRSIAILDTALRRRFYFREIEPDVDVIRRTNELVGEINICELFETINERITLKLDRDHRIGHSYFLNIHNIEVLKTIWYYQIIPLIMEYFYNDGEVISSIIGSSFIDKKTCHIKWIDNNDDFVKAIKSIKVNSTITNEAN